MTGLSQTVVVPDGAVVLIQAHGGFQTAATAVGGFSIVDVTLWLGNTPPYQQLMRRRVTATTVTAAETGYGYWDMALTLELLPGSHFIQVAAQHSALGVAAYFGGSSLTARQAALTVTVLKQ